MCVKLLLLGLMTLQYGTAQIAVYNLKLADLHKMQTGIGWPHSLHVTEGHEALLKLASSLENQQSCEVTTPAGVTFDVQQPPSNRYEAWSDACGVRVKTVIPSDQGRWRLTAMRGNNSITGWTEVHVEGSVSQYSGAPITLHDGQYHTPVDLTTLANSYCLVAQPFTDRTLVPGHCSVTLDRASRAVQGNWHVLLGLPGRVAELPIDRSVIVETERLDVGFIREGNKLHLYCNVMHTEKNITFCRFQLSTAQAGFNVMDGLSDGSHSYYGEGFAKRHCGLTIERATAADYGTWRCTVGVKERVGTIEDQKTPLQALIRVTGGQSTRNEALKDDTGRTIFVQKHSAVTISCEADASLSYCWFQHPNGTQFTPVPKLSDDQLFWYSGESLSVGDCGITFTYVTDEDSGLWKCHMGPRDRIGVEITDQVAVRVTGPLAAREKKVLSVEGGNTTLYCHTSNGNRPLDYCRFLTPNFVGISIDPTVTKGNAILGRFYFTPGRDLNYGDCSLTIDPLLAEDIGQWTCAALLDDETLESRDTIELMVQVRSGAQAGLIGMGVGLSFLILVMGGVMVYKYGLVPRLARRQQSNSSDQNDIMSMRTMPSENSFRLSTGSGSSASSNSSGAQLNSGREQPNSGREQPTSGREQPNSGREQPNW